jgi:2-polyprenyl-3-methyl-5-hydroxy-6-metoxy-1,4-benzoquinol methylase
MQTTVQHDVCILCGEMLSPGKNKGIHSSLLKCQSCGLISKEQQTHAKNLEAWWGDPERFLAYYVQGETWRRIVAKKNLTWIGRHSKINGSLLDVGCAAGFFLDEASRVGWECWGVDIARPLVQYAENRFSQCKVFLGEPCGLDLPMGYFDAITMYDTLGYAVDPQALLKKVTGLLIPGGKLFLTNLCADWLLGKKEELLSFNYYFSPSVMANCLSRSGLNMVDQFVQPKNMNTASIFSFAWFRLALPIVNRNSVKMIYTVAQKPA